MLTRQIVYKGIKDFIQSAEDQDIHFDKVFLFGSFAQGKQHRYSDIDLAVFSKQFTSHHGENFSLIQYTRRLPQMQLHLYPLEEYNGNDFVEVIKKGAISFKE